MRLAELMAALSVAVDLGLGETVEHAQRSAVISVALSDAAGLTAEQAQDAYYLSLLQTVGCTGDHDFAFRKFGEDMGDWIPLAMMGAPMELMGDLVRNVGRGQAPLKRARTLARAFGVPARGHAQHADPLRGGDDAVGAAGAGAAGGGRPGAGVRALGWAGARPTSCGGGAGLAGSCLAAGPGHRARRPQAGPGWRRWT